jgi:DNA uptake protein ComE-like DNA-binding protein
VTGIGPALADKIISGRPYSSRQELQQRGILPQNTFDELDHELTVREKRFA